MENLKNRVIFLSLMFISIFCISNKNFADPIYSSLQTIRLVDGNIIATWTEYDPNISYGWIVGVTGSISSDPSTWNITNLFDTLPSNSILSANQMMTVDANGNAIIFWEYTIPPDYPQIVATAVLPAGGSSWSVISITDDLTPSSRNMTVNIDADGNVLATWQAYNSDSSIQVIRGVTGNFSDGAFSGWSMPFNLSPESD